MNKSKTIWDLAIELGQKKSSSKNKRSLLFVGSKQSGKTSIIYRFLERKDEPKPTLALDYLFAQKQRFDDAETLSCDLWEIGEATYLLNLLPFIIREDQIESLCLVLVLDLSRPNELVTITETLLSAISDQIDSVMQKLPKNRRRSSVRKDKSIDHLSDTMIKKMNPGLPIPVFLMANKYDLFQEMESDDRKIINKYLCSLTQSYGCSLVYTSIKRDQLISRFRSLLAEQAFGSSSNDRFEAKLEHNKPIWLPFEADPSSLLDGDSLVSLRSIMTSRWPQVTIDLVIPDDPAKDENFKERDVDMIRAQRDEELENYRRQLDLKKEKIIL